MSRSRLDEPASRRLPFRALIQCGETWARLAAARKTDLERESLNLPAQAASWDALAALAREVLEPISDHWGALTLTYGFAGSALARAIGRRIAPQLDQHAACEVDRRGRPICARLGAAVDLAVPGTSSFRVARWIAAHTPFDRLYVYEPDRPLHVSFGPDHARSIVAVARDGPRVTPRRLARDDLDGLADLPDPLP